MTLFLHNHDFKIANGHLSLTVFLALKNPVKKWSLSLNIDQFQRTAIKKGTQVKLTDSGTSVNDKSYKSIEIM